MKYISTEVPDLLKSVAHIINDVERRRAAEAATIAPAFSPFEFVTSGELGLSRLLAWLLDPRGTHGQGGRFLFLLVEALDLGWDEGRCARAHVRVEVATDYLPVDRRIDILVVADGHALAIENKPWAADQRLQVADYLRHLEKRYAARERSLVYLTPTGRSPSNESIGKEDLKARLRCRDLRLYSFPQVLSWLAECRKDCRAGRVADFIGEFEGFIAREFCGVRDQVEHTRIVGDMSASPVSVKAALAVARSAEAMKVYLLHRLADSLGDAVAARGWSAKYHEGDAGRALWSRIMVCYGGPWEASFALEFNHDMRSGSAFGLYAPNLDAAARVNLNKALVLAFGKGKFSDGWPWFRSPSPADGVLAVEADWAVNDAPWVRISDGTLAPALAAAAVRFHERLSAIGFIPKGPHGASLPPSAAPALERCPSE